MKRKISFVIVLMLVAAILVAFMPAPIGSSVVQFIDAESNWDDDLVNWHKTSLPNDQIKATLDTPEGVKFVSYSGIWNEDRLKELYGIFKQMMIGDEVRYLSKVVISNEISLFTTGAYFSSHYINGLRYDLAPGRIIVLYNAFRSTDDIASTLAHEYGHHFSYYWISKKEGKLPNDPETGWAKIRDLSNYPVVWANSGLKAKHAWMPQEIMADEYAILFGPPELRETIVGKTKTSLVGRVENDLIPLPDNNPRIRNYWLTISGHEEAPLEPLNPPIITSIEAVRQPYAYKWDYIIEFEPATTDPERQQRIEYFVRWKHSYFDGQSIPVTGEDQIFYSRYVDGKYNKNYQEPKWKGYFAVYAFDRETGQYVKGEPVWFDLSNPAKPVSLQDPYDPSAPTLQIVFDDEQKQGNSKT